MYNEIETISKGDFLRLKKGAKKTFEMKGYCRENKAYEVSDYGDISEFRYLKKGRLVFTGFEF